MSFLFGTAVGDWIAPPVAVAPRSPAELLYDSEDSCEEPAGRTGPARRPPAPKTSSGPGVGAGLQTYLMRATTDPARRRKAAIRWREAGQYHMISSEDPNADAKEAAHAFKMAGAGHALFNEAMADHTTGTTSAAAWVRSEGAMLVRSERFEADVATLLRAARRGDTAAVQSMLDRTPALLNRQDSQASLPPSRALAATRRRTPRHASALVFSPGLLQGYTALHAAALGSNEAVVAQLLQRGAAVGIVSGFGRTPLHDARPVRHACPPPPLLRSPQQRAGRLPLLLASKSRRRCSSLAPMPHAPSLLPRALSFLPSTRRSTANVRMLLDAGADVNRVSVGGLRGGTTKAMTPLELSTKWGTIPVAAAGFAVPTKVSAGISTSSPGSTPASSRQVWRAALPLTVATTWLTPVYSPSIRSKPST